jgi:hypothetical protein
MPCKLSSFLCRFSLCLDAFSTPFFLAIRGITDSEAEATFRFMTMQATRPNFPPARLFPRLIADENVGKPHQSVVVRLLDSTVGTRHMSD